jgi:hypothetical protein
VITVFDVKGARVMDPQPAENVELTLNISALAAGIYLVRVEAGDRVSAVKFVKEYD